MVQTAEKMGGIQEGRTQPNSIIRAGRKFGGIVLLFLTGSTALVGAHAVGESQGRNSGLSIESRRHCPPAEQSVDLATGASIKLDNPKTAANPDLVLTNKDGHLSPDGPLAAAVHQDTRLNDPNSGTLTVETSSSHMLRQMRFALAGQTVTLTYVADPNC